MEEEVGTAEFDEVLAALGAGGVEAGEDFLGALAALGLVAAREFLGDDCGAQGVFGVPTRRDPDQTPQALPVNRRLTGHRPPRPATGRFNEACIRPTCAARL